MKNYWEYEGEIHYIDLDDPQYARRVQEFTASTRQAYEAQEYSAIFQRIKSQLDDVGKIYETMISNENKFSRCAFTELTGVHLSAKQGERLEQIKEYYGERWNAWKASLQAEEEARQAQEAAEKAQEYAKTLEKYKAGKYINAEQFLAICDNSGVKVPIRTRGWIIEKVEGISIKNIYGSAKKTTKAFSNIWYDLNTALGLFCHIMFTVGASKVEAWIKKPLDVWKQEFTGEYMGTNVDSWENLGGALK